MSRIRFAAFASIFFLVPLARSQDLPAPSPLDLVRGLRENGLPDLALEYLAEISSKAAPDLAKVLPLERAKVRLELATAETDEALRGVQIAQAKLEFDAFLKSNPNHPRTPEAAVAIAQLLTLEGKTQLQRARREPDDESKIAAAAKARPIFDQAAKRYEQAASGLEKLANAADLPPMLAKELTRDYYQALLDQGSNLLNIAESYILPRANEAAAQMKSAREATLVFIGLSKKDSSHPLCWVAKAWVGEAYRLQGEPTKAELALKELLADARKANAPPGATAGLRMARFFLLREAYSKGITADSKARLEIRNLCRDWLRDYPTNRPTQEVYATLYYLGTALLNEGLKRENLNIEKVKPVKPEDPTEKIVGMKAEGLVFLREADLEFRKIVRTDNEYTDRAGRQRARALFWLVGNADRPPEQFKTFDECYMAALVQLEKLREAKPEEGKAISLKAIALLERAKQLPIPKESSREAAQANLSLAQSYINANRPLEGAQLAENIARTARSPAQIARAGAVAIYGFQTALDLADSSDTEARTKDRSRILALAQFVEKTAPDDPVTDDVRLQLGVLYSLASRPVEMFEVLSRVPNRYGKIYQTRLYQGIAAYELIRPRGASEAAGKDELPQAKKDEIFGRIVADINGTPAYSAALKPEDALFYFKMRLQLAQLHLARGGAEYATAEKIANDALAQAKAFPNLPGDEKEKFAMRCEQQLLRAVYAQAMPLVVEAKYAAAAERFAPLLSQVLKAGPAAKEGQTGELKDLARSLDADRIRLLLEPTLNARIREGAVSKTVELLDELKKFGGNIATSARVVQQGVANIRPTVEALRREGKTDEAAKLVSSVAGMVTKLAEEKNLPNEVRLNLGRSFRDLGDYAKAIELLTVIPAPANPAFLPGDPKVEVPPTETDDERKKREDDFDSNKSAANLYRQAQLELLRCYRLVKSFDKADAILDEALGKPDATKTRKGGWGVRFSDFRRESLYLIEAKATEDSTPAKSIPLWNEAKKGWSTWANEYKGGIDRANLAIGKSKSDSLKLTVRLEVFAEATKVEKADVPRAIETVRKIYASTAEKADPKLKNEIEVKTLYLKAQEEELLKMSAEDISVDAIKVQAALAAVDKGLGEQERSVTGMKSVWFDLQAEQLRASAMAQIAVNGKNPTELAKALEKLSATIVEFETKNAPLPSTVRQKLHDLIAGQEPMKEAYTKVGGIDSLKAPRIEQP